MIDIIIGILIGFVIVWIVVNIWVALTKVKPIEIDRGDLISDPIFDEIKCPKCNSYKYGVYYLDPLFNTGKYARCKTCGSTFDLDEDESLGTFEKGRNINIR